MTTPDCASHRILSLCASGQLADGDADRLFQHLDQCPDCTARLDEITRDSGSFADRLAQANQTVIGHDTPVPLQRAMDRVLGRELDPSTTPTGIGSFVEGYQLLEELGRGGIGRVYLASHPRLEQLVALKMLGRSVRTSEDRKRLETEWQALSRMEHPQIARVLDGGATLDGQPYFVMERIRGSSITDYADAQRLTVGQRLELILQVCQAVQHAHQKAIIHRDLKPSNVLVTEYDRKPTVKVIDFGIAKVLNESAPGSTQDGMLIGTPEFMSPEQAGLNAGQVDIRSDVFSLGILLYQLLCGRSPFRDPGEPPVPVLEQLRRVREDDCPRPEQLLRECPTADAIAARRCTSADGLIRQLRGDLTWIMLRALQKRPDERYESVTQLAADLRCHLAREPVSVGPPSNWYRLRKAVSRNRMAVTFAGLLLLTMLAGSVGTVFGLIRTARERDDKTKALTQMEFQREQTAAALDLEARQRARADVATERTLVALQTLTEETVSRLLLARPELSADDRAFLDRIMAQYEEFSKTTDGSLKARIVEAEAHHRIAILRWRMGDNEAAAVGYRKSLALWKAICDEAPDRHDLKRAMADSHSNLGIVLAELRQFEASEAAHRTAIEMHQKLAQEFPEESSYRRNVANCQNSYGVMLKDVGRNAETIDQYRQAIAIQEQLAAESPDDEQALHFLASTRGNLALELQQAGQPDEAKDILREVITVGRQLRDRAPDDPERTERLAGAMVNLGMMLAQEGKAAEAIELFLPAEQMLADISSRYPAVASYRRVRMSALQALAQLFKQQSQPKESEVRLRQFADVAGQLSRDDPGDRALRNELARVQLLRALRLREVSDWPAAVEACRLGIAAYRQLAAESEATKDERVLLADGLIILEQLCEKAGLADDRQAASREAMTLLDELVTAYPEDEKLRKRLTSLRARLADPPAESSATATP